MSTNLVPSHTLSLVDDIQRHYGSLDHKLNFTQTLRSSADFVYKHSISVGILSAMISNEMQLPAEDIRALITASLLYDFGYLYVPRPSSTRATTSSDSDRNFIPDESGTRL